MSVLSWFFDDIPVIVKRMTDAPTDIEHFINSRFKKDSDWLTGNCLWFAIILKTRFEESEIYYDPIAGHFFVECRGGYYDWTGKIERPKVCQKFEDIKNEDPLLYGRLIRDCFS